MEMHKVVLSPDRRRERTGLVSYLCTISTLSVDRANRPINDLGHSLSSSNTKIRFACISVPVETSRVDFKCSRLHIVSHVRLWCSTPRGYILVNAFCEMSSGFVKARLHCRCVELSTTTQNQTPFLSRSDFDGDKKEIPPE